MQAAHTEEVLYLPHTKLELHPRNMRRVYPKVEVMQMARSIWHRVKRGQTGIIQPLIGCRENGSVIVAVGNKRLMGIRYLAQNGEAPLVPVILRERSEVEQLMDMVTENLIRSSPDPVSEGVHYTLLLEQTGKSRSRLARETGVALATINNRLRLLELGPEIQELITLGDRPHGREPGEARLSITDITARVETAQALADKRAGVQLIKSTCTRVRRKLEHRNKVRSRKRRTEARITFLPWKTPWPRDRLRQSTKSRGTTSRHPPRELVNRVLLGKKDIYLAYPIRLGKSLSNEPGP